MYYVGSITLGDHLLCLYGMVEALPMNVTLARLHSIAWQGVWMKRRGMGRTLSLHTVQMSP